MQHAALVGLTLAVGAAGTWSIAPVPARAAEWWSVSYDDREYHFADRETVTSVRIRGRALTQVWTSIYRPDDAQRYVRGMDALWLFDCNRRQAAPKAVIEYRDGAETSSEEADDGELEFFSAAPETFASAYLGFACNAHLGAGESTTFQANGFEYAWVENPAKAIEALHASQSQPTAAKRRETKDPPGSSGTAFFVNSRGYAVTNAHVVDGCGAVSSSRWGQATVVAVDAASDLALLRTASANSAHAALRLARPRLGEPISVAGFPLSQLLGTGLRVTSGTVSGLSGPGGNRTYFQISAPVQPGNSGGPVVDADGALVGVVAARLSDVEAISQTGGIPQNVNFAVSGSVVGAFLDENGITADGAPSAAKPVEYTFRIECRAAGSRGRE